jgi:hypothetical protein
MLPALSCLGQARCKPNLIACCCPVDALQNQFKVEGKLHLANDEYRRITVPQAQDVTTIDLAFDQKAKVLHERFNGKVEIAFSHHGTRLYNNGPAL